MTAAIYDEVVTFPAAPHLHVVRDVPAPKKAARRAVEQPFSDNDPLIVGAARLLSIPMRHIYAALWRAGVLEVQA